MSTMEHTPTATGLSIVGVVSTAPVLTRSLPDLIPHISFHIETPEQPGFNVHADGTLAELAQLTVHRRDRISVVVKRIYRTSSKQITPDVDAEAIDLDLHGRQ